MTRILMTADAVGGVWTYALDLAQALEDQGYRTTLATMGPAPTPDQLAEAARVTSLELEVSTFALEWMDDPWGDVDRAGRWLLNLARRIKPAVVHLNGYSHAAAGFLPPVVCVGHSCVVSWNEATGGSISAETISRYRRRVAEGLRAADCVVAPTSAMLSLLQRHYGPLPRACAIFNGRDAAGFPAVRKEPLVLAAGRLWDRAKNVGAVQAIADRLTWPLEVVGTATIGGQRVSQSEMLRHLARASILALPARYEPFGLLPLEAALSGCALVLGDIASLREVWGTSALFVDPDDPDEIEAAIESLIADPAQLRARASAARERAEAFTASRMAAGYAALYRALGQSRLCA